MKTKNYMGILSEVDEAQCIWLLAHGLNERGSVPITIQDTFLLSIPSFLVVTQCLAFSRYRLSCLRRTERRKLKLTAHIYLVPSQRMRGGILLLHGNQTRYLLYASTEKI